MNLEGFVILTDEEINAELNRKKGRSSEYGKALDEILAKVNLDERFGVRFNIPGKTSQTVAAGLNLQIKHRKIATLKARPVKGSETDVTLVNSFA